MTTIVNNPNGSGDGSGSGVIIGVIVALLLIALFFMYGLPAIRHQGAPAGTNINVSLPTAPAAPAPAQ